MSPRYLDSVYGLGGQTTIRARTRLLAEPLTPDELPLRPDLLAEVEVLFSGWNAPVLDAELLARMPRLRAVFYAGGSVRYFIRDAFWDRNITLCSSYALNGEAVADYTVGAALFALKLGFVHAQRARGGAFARDLVVPGVYGSTVALISLGASGMAVARKLAPFKVKLIAFDPHFPAERARQLGIELAPTLEQAFSDADLVSLHTPLLPATEGMICGGHFRRMKPGATFINTARGAVVREQEMISVLRERTDLTAILDVTDPEPPVPGSPLYAMPNVVLTPHVAGAVERECERLGRAMIEEFDRWLNGQPLRHQIRREMLPIMA